jgi:hypothetical protein
MGLLRSASAALANFRFDPPAIFIRCVGPTLLLISHAEAVESFAGEESHRPAVGNVVQYHSSHDPPERGKCDPLQRAASS